MGKTNTVKLKQNACHYKQNKKALITTGEKNIAMINL
jgi:hypothetical protein